MPAFSNELREAILQNMKYKAFTISVTTMLFVYASYIFIHSNALVFQAMGEYSYSHIVRGLAKYGSFAFMTIWIIQFVWFLRSEKSSRLISLLSWTNICLIPCIILINVIPYTGILG